MAGKIEKPCGGVFIPKVNEASIPCKDYKSTDCVYVSDAVNFAPFQLHFNDSMSNLLNCMLSELRELNKEVNLLKREVNKIK